MIGACGGLFADGGSASGVSGVAISCVLGSEGMVVVGAMASATELACLMPVSTVNEVLGRRLRELNDLFMMVSRGSKRGADLFLASSYVG